MLVNNLVFVKSSGRFHEDPTNKRRTRRCPVPTTPMGTAWPLGVSLQPSRSGLRVRVSQPYSLLRSP